MIEVLFGESEAESMKVAKCEKVTDRKNDGPTAVIGSRAVEPQEEKENAVTWISGSSKEVICLGFLLDIGDIKETPDSTYRKDLIYSLYNHGQWGQDTEMEKELLQAGAFYAEKLLRLRQYLKQGEPVRIWYSDSPYSLCGFYFLCSELINYKSAVWVVKLPAYEIKKNRIRTYHSWGDIGCEEFAGFLRYERVLSREEMQMYGHMWFLLREENAPLRAFVNGTLTSVEADFYDFLIFRQLTKTPIKQAKLIGDIMGKYPIGIGDWWYAVRIQEWIKQGKIKVLEDSEQRYRRIICLATGN